MSAGVGDLLLAELALTGEEETESAKTLSAIEEQLGLSSQALSQQLELVNTIEELQEAGTIEVDDASDDGNDGLLLRLTESGRQQASDVRERLAAVEIEVVDGDDRTTMELGEAASQLDRPLTEIAAELSDDGIYYRETSPDEGLIDREDASEQCRSVIETARSTGRGQAAFLAGPSGIGKTTLAEAVLDDLDDEFDAHREWLDRAETHLDE